MGGDVTANGKVTLGASATISGTITEKASLPPVPPGYSGHAVVCLRVGRCQHCPGSSQVTQTREIPQPHRQEKRYPDAAVRKVYFRNPILLEQDASIKVDLSRWGIAGRCGQDSVHG